MAYWEPTLLPDKQFKTTAVCHEGSLIDRIMRRIFALVICCLLCALTAGAQQVRWNADYQAYIDRYKDIAIEEMVRYRIPASITLAQGLLESGAGKSYLSTHGNNHFGIKSHGWSGRTLRHDDDRRQESFRAYDSVRESFEDHSLFLAGRERYQRLFSLSTTDYKGWARGLKECGYATNPAYAQRLISIIETYKLYEYDRVPTQRRVTTPAPPAVSSGKAVAVHPPHTVMQYNQNYFVYSHNGDSFESLGRELGVPASKLAKYNERSVTEPLRDGDVIYLKKKQKHAEARFKGQCHVVQPGESMYLISQKYGIRLTSLYKMNHLSPNYTIQPGHRLKVY